MLISEPSIIPDDLKAVHDKETLFAFLRQSLGWPVDEDDPFTYPIPDTHDTIAVSQILPFHGDDPFVILLAEFPDNFRRTDLRGILQGIRRKMREEAKYTGKTLSELVFVCPVDNYQGVRFAHFEEREGRAPKLKIFGWERSQADATRTLRAINLQALKMPALNLIDEPNWDEGYKRWMSAWNVEAVTRAFFKDYRDVFEKVIPQVENVPEADCRTFTQRLFNRLLFVQFLSKKGWLRFGKRTDYLPALWADYGKSKGKDSNFYRERLTRLFFMGLNTAHTVNLQAISSGGMLRDTIGDVPFLNGGLFEQGKEDNPDASVPDDAIQLILDVFQQYNFTITESTPDDVEVAVDPEMLGEVFEKLVTNDERHDTGSYYTPRGIVTFMCRESLKGYLGGHEVLVDERRAYDFPLHTAKELLQKLADVRIVDPACGSGAYLLGMLHELYELTGMLEVRVQPLTEEDKYRRKLAIIQNNLYGVDKAGFAVETARLRLWLSLVVDDKRDALAEPRPDVALPNLDFKIEQGDSLAAASPEGGQQLDLFRQQDIDEFKILKDKYSATHQSGEKKDLYKAVCAKRDAIANFLRPVKKGATPAPVQDNGNKPFDWQVEFAEVFFPSPPIADIGGAMNFGDRLAEPPRPGGFDIVLANPPYVHAGLITDQKPRLKIVYPEVYTGTADLYCFFYARAVQLLRAGGMLAFISSNKWFRADYGKNLKAYLADRCTVSSITDFGELPVFQNAATFPMIFIACKNSPVVKKNCSEPQQIMFTQVKSLDPPYPDVLALISHAGSVLPANALSASNWQLTDAKNSAVLRKMEAAGVPLSHYVNDQIYRGILTGFNTAFVINGAKRAELIAADPKSAEIIKPLAVGDDVRRWRIERKDKWLIITKIGVDMKRYPAVFDHLSQWQSSLEKRWDKGEHWWELRSCTYYHMFDKAKIVFPDIAKEPRFTLDNVGTYTNDTTFMLGQPDLFLLGVLNSATVWRYLNLTSAVLGDADQGGRLRLKPIYVRQVPIPNASGADRTAISALVQQCLDAKGVDCQAWEREIDERVAALYGL